MRTKPVLVALAAIAVVAAAVVAIAASGGDGDSTGLPPVEGTTPPSSYRIVYQVTTPDSASEEEHVVHRPFGAYIAQRSTDGAVTAERWSALGKLITRSQGAPAVAITTSIAPSASDVRPERFSAGLVDADRLIAHEDRIDINGRTCRILAEAGEVSTADDGALSAGDLGSVPVLVSRCVDDQGLVLEERWTTADGERVLTKRASLLELGDDVPTIDLPDAEPLPDAQGNGAIRKVADDEPPPFNEVFALPDPEGFTFVGRYAVVPARISAGGQASTDVAIALYTDVWRRGPDLLLLDQGATRGAPAPFDPKSRVGEADLGGLGSAELAVDLRSAEVRMTRPDDGFVRLSGTIAPGELVRIARTLQVLQAAAR